MRWLRRPAAGEDIALTLRAVVLVHGCALAESVLSVVAFGWPPRAGEALANHLVRTGQIGVLGVLLLLASLFAIRLPGARMARLRALGSRAVRELCRPSVVVRLAVVFAATAPVFAVTLARSFDLAWHVASAMAFAAVALASLIELGVALRREAAPARGHPLGRAAWIIAAGGIGLLVCPLLLTGEALTLIMLYVFCPQPRLARRAVAGAVAALGLGAVVGGIGLDAARPTLRRLSSIYCGYSAVGGSTARWFADLDGDGSSGALGLDCDDRDPDRFPKARDVPGDQVDQNCSGHDAKAAGARARWAAGGPPRPQPGATTPARRPNVYLITIDGLRWRELLGSRAMPLTRAWAEGCLRFGQARTNSTQTNLSLVALHSGLLPQHVLHGPQGGFGRASTPEGASPPLLAAVLRRAGFGTYAVVPMAPYTREVLGDFEVNHPGFPRAPEALRVLRELTRRARGRPVFLWAHLMELHAPYPGGLAHAHYAAAVRRLDAPLARLLGQLGDDALVVLTADHGEAFGEHGQRFHGSSLFDEELRVPLVICAPTDRSLGPPRPIDTTVGLVDVLPTVLELVGLSGATGYPLHGESLVAHLRHGAARRSPWAYSVIWSPGGHAQALTVGCSKLIRDLDREWSALFDVCTDPAETVDLTEVGPDVVRRLEQLRAAITDQAVDAYGSVAPSPR